MVVVVVGGEGNNSIWGHCDLLLSNDVGGVDGGAAGLTFSLFSFFFLWVVFLTPHSCCFLFFLLFDDDDDDDDDDVEGTCCCCCCCCSWFSMSRTSVKT